MMKNAKILIPTIVFTVVLLLAVFMLINVLAHSYNQDYRPRGGKGYNQNISRQGLLQIDELRMDLFSQAKNLPLL